MRVCLAVHTLAWRWTHYMNNIWLLYETAVDQKKGILPVALMCKRQSHRGEDWTLQESWTGYFLLSATWRWIKNRWLPTGNERLLAVAFEALTQ